MSKSKGRWLTELAVITLGVGIALAADSGVERVRQRSLAQEALVAVQRDLHADIRQLDRRIPRNESFFGAIDRLSVYAEEEAALTDSLAFLQDLGHITLYLTFDANTAAVESLISSGQMELISDEALRSALLSYVRGVSNVAEMDAQHRAVSLDARARLMPQFVTDTRWRAWNQSEADAELRYWAARAVDRDAPGSADALRELLFVTSQLVGFKVFQYRSLRESAQELSDLLDQSVGRR